MIMARHGELSCGMMAPHTVRLHLALLVVQTAEFMGSDPLMAALGLRIALIAYPVVALSKVSTVCTPACVAVDCLQQETALLVCVFIAEKRTYMTRARASMRTASCCILCTVTPDAHQRA